MNRRTFFRAIGTTLYIGPMGVIAAIKLIPKRRKSFTVPLTNTEKEYIISQALETPEGRAALAKAMIEPIRDQVEYDETGIPCCGHDYNTMNREELVAKWGPETDYETRKEQINKLRIEHGYKEI